MKLSPDRVVLVGHVVCKEILAHAWDKTQFRRITMLPAEQEPDLHMIELLFLKDAPLAKFQPDGHYRVVISIEPEEP